jgi:hypothetical protein
MATCRCGCWRTVHPTRCPTGYARGCQHRSRKEYFSRIGKIVHRKQPGLHKERLAMARRATQQRTAERVRGMTKQQAYTAGYKAASQRMYRYWKYRIWRTTTVVQSAGSRFL